MVIKSKLIGYRRLIAWPHAILAPFTLVVLIPLAQVVFNSMRTTGEIQTFPLGFPKGLSFAVSNFRETWDKGGYANGYFSTVVIAVLTVFIVCTVVSCAAYALAKHVNFNKNFYLFYFTIGLSIPTFAYIVPDFFLLRQIKLVDSYLGITFIYAAQNLPFNLLLMRAFFMGIPRELEESAKMDGCSEIGALWHITIPLSKTIITTISLLVFVHVWNEFLFSNTLLQTDKVRTVAVRYYKFVAAYSSNLSRIYAASVITILPIVILFLLLQRKFIEGITQGGVKG
jgi:raffinose/stachyose/melibiose transport system permease protein